MSASNTVRRGRGARRRAARAFGYSTMRGRSDAHLGCVAAVQIHLEREAQNGGYEAAERSRGRHPAFLIRRRGCWAADATRLPHIENATRAWDMAFYAISLPPRGHATYRARRVRQQLHRTPNQPQFQRVCGLAIGW